MVLKLWRMYKAKMKALLVCTDFSEPSKHAARYSCMLAREYGFSYITLFHTYKTFIPAAAVPLVPHTEDTVYKAALKQLRELEQELQPLAGPEILISVRADNISLADNINKVCDSENCDIVVMGMKGKSNIEKVLTGSNTIKVAEKSYYPVLNVPAETAFQPVRHVLIACDLSNVAQTVPVTLMNEVLELFDAPLTVLNVDHRDKHFSPQTPDDIYRLHHIFDRYYPHYAFTENKDIAGGILEYAKKNHISLIITIPKNYNFFENIFHKRISEQLIYHSNIPILTLHAPG